MSQITGVSLFAGIGGFELAMQRNGVKVVASAEINATSKEILISHFPESKQLGDVLEITGTDLISAGFVPERGIITGGFPCQDLSVGGKRLGFSGQRSSLFYQIPRLAEETGAEWLLLENVTGLLESQRGADMGAVVGTLVDCGYGVAWRVLDAQYFGVPQRRRRVFIVARRNGQVESAGKVLFEPEDVPVDSDQSGAWGPETARAIAERAGCADGKGYFTFIKSRPAEHKEDYEVWSPGSIDKTLSGFNSGESRATSLLVHGDTVRRPTPDELDQLQGFPRGWTEGHGDVARYKKLGDAVAVPVAEWVIRRIVNQMQ